MDDGLVDAVEAFFEAGKSGDFEEAASAYKDMCRLAKDSGYKESEDEEKSDGKGKPLALLIGSMKK